MSITLSNPSDLSGHVNWNEKLVICCEENFITKKRCKNTVTNIKLNQKWLVTLKITIVNKNGQAACPSFQL